MCTQHGGEAWAQREHARPQGSRRWGSKKRALALFFFLAREVPVEAWGQAARKRSRRALRFLPTSAVFLATACVLYAAARAARGGMAVTVSASGVLLPRPSQRRHREKAGWARGRMAVVRSGIHGGGRTRERFFERLQKLLKLRFLDCLQYVISLPSEDKAAADCSPWWLQLARPLRLVAELCRTAGRQMGTYAAGYGPTPTCSWGRLLGCAVVPAHRDCGSPCLVADIVCSGGDIVNEDFGALAKSLREESSQKTSSK